MATTLSGQVSALATQVGVDVKGIIANIGTLSNLTTTQKASLVVALNELKKAIDDLDSAVSGSVGIDDTAMNTATTWSSSKINTAINSAISALINGAPNLLNDLNELATAITENASAIEALEAIADDRVRFKAEQTLTEQQKVLARKNIGSASSADLTTLDTKVGALTDLDSADKSSIVASINEALSKAGGAQSTATSALNKANQNTDSIGALNGLSTTAKTTIVNAINEVATKVTTLEANVGDTTTDFVAVYATARGS